jgi:hypothetical protein
MSTIDSLHAGMNLRDPDTMKSAGETGVSVGCDFSVPGIITPMKEGLLTWQYSEDVQDAHIVYLDDLQYVFATTETGLYVVGGRYLTPHLIDSDFTGIFKAIAVNGFYALFSNASLSRKWKPGWDATYQASLNTPRVPLLMAAPYRIIEIDLFEDLTGWTIEGGGTAGAIEANTAQHHDGNQSMKLTCTQGETIIATKLVDFDLSRFPTDSEYTTDDIGYGKTGFYFYTGGLSHIDSITMQFSCAEAGGFGKDYYTISMDLSDNDSDDTTLSYSDGIYTPSTSSGELLVDTNIDGVTTTRESWDPSLQTVGVYTHVTEQEKVDGSGWETTKQQFVRRTLKNTVSSNSYSWTKWTPRIKEFVRHGDTDGRDWSTITAIQIKIKVKESESFEQVSVSFDTWKLWGGGRLYGHYWIAVAFQNELGNYGPFSNFAGPVELDVQALLIKHLRPDTDDQTVKRRIALVSSAISEPMVIYVEDNGSTEYSHDAPDTSLTTVEEYFNNRKPPQFTDMVLAFNRVWGVTGDRLYYSPPGMLEGIPALNYLSMPEGEDLKQIVAIGQYIVVRGRNREYLIQITDTNPLYWRQTEGSSQGAVSSRCLIELDQTQVYMSKTGFYASSLGSGSQGYLLKINPAISKHSEVIGANAGDFAFVAFTDKDGTSRVMRIDYSMGSGPVPHYVSNDAVLTVFADKATKKVYYALGSAIYEFNAGPLPLPVSLDIPTQYFGSRAQKDFSALSYWLENGTLSMVAKVDGVDLDGTFSLPPKGVVDDPISLPAKIGRGIGFTLFTVGTEKEVTRTVRGAANIDEEWLYYQKITIHHEQVEGDLENFPAGFQINDVDNHIFDHALANGYDIFFTASDGETVLDYERSVWDVTNHMAVFYVRVPALSSAVDTVIYVFYGNPAITTDLQNATDAWDSNFRAVYHFEENPYTTTNSPRVTGVLKDSTANGFDLSVALDNSSVFTFPADRLVSSVMGHGWRFAGDAVVKDLTAAIFGGVKPGAVTVEGVLTCTNTAVRTGWFVLCQIATGIASMEGALNCGEPYYSTWGWWVWWKPNVANGIVSGIQGAAYEVSAWTDDYDLATERHIAHVAVDGGVYSAYVDGTFIGDGYTTANFNYTGNGENSLYLAKALRVNDDNLTGVMSEVRISNVERSAAWLATTSNNLKQNSYFFSLGDEGLISDLVIEKIKESTTAETEIVVDAPLDFVLHLPIDVEVIEIGS